MRSSRNIVTGGLALLVLTSLLGACKEGDPLETMIGPATADFVPEAVPGAVTGRHVSLRKSAVDGGRIVLDLVVTEVDQPVSGIAVKLAYPREFTRFIRCTDGELFSPPAPCFSSEPARGSGVVFIARAVTAGSQATTVSGSRVIARLEFLVFGVDADRIEFLAQNLGGGDASALLDVNGDPIFMQWFSGVLRGT